MSETKDPKDRATDEDFDRLLRLAAGGGRRHSAESRANHPPDEDLAAYVAGDLRADRLGEVQVHLSHCGDCLAMTEWLRRAEEPNAVAAYDSANNVDTATTRRPDRLHEELVARLHADIVRRERESPSAREWDEAAVPSDELVELAGRLAASASAGLLAVCRAEIWPRVRTVLSVESAGALAIGSYGGCLAAARSLLHTEVADDMAARELLVFRPRRPAAPDLASAGDTWNASCLALLRTRLNAAWYLAGLDELWPFEGAPAARRLWHEGGLKDLDDYLRDRVDLLRPLTTDLRASAVDLPVCATGQWSGVLRNIMPPQMLAEAPDVRQVLCVRDFTAEAVVLLRALLHDELGDEGDETAVRTMRSARDPLLEVESQDGALVAVWFAGADADSLALDYRGHTAFDAVFRARVHLLSGADDEAGELDEPVRLPRFEGVAPPASFTIASDTLVVPGVAFEGGHEEAVARLRRVLTS